MKDALGDRMKMYEQAEAGRRFMPLLPIIARIDGRAFSKFTKGMDRPFDRQMSHCMLETTISLVKETGACIGYTQSDEISLAWYSPTIKSQVWFDGRIAKMTSQLGALSTLYFNKLVSDRMPAFSRRNPTFDARVWTVPTLAEGANVFIWRQLDAMKNSVSMAASEYFSHKELLGKNTNQKKQMLFDVGVNWGFYHEIFKRGLFVQRQTKCLKFTPEEIERLPHNHEARKNPNMTYNRSFVAPVSVDLTKVSNREGFIFKGEEPIMESRE